MDRFIMNGIVWSVYFVHPNSLYLIDRTGKRTVATTDTKTKCVYLSEELYGDFLKKVLLHELGHCALFSYNLLDDVRRAVPPTDWINAEEWICNVIAEHGSIIFDNMYKIYGTHSWKLIPNYLEKVYKKHD